MEKHKQKVCHNSKNRRRSSVNVHHLKMEYRFGLISKFYGAKKKKQQTAPRYEVIRRIERVFFFFFSLLIGPLSIHIYVNIS